MNKRIEELYLQAFPPSLSDSTLVTTSANEFAKRIIRDCLAIVEMNESELHHDNGMYPVHLTMCEIKDHFGVGE